MIYIGIDPGKDGCIVALSSDGKLVSKHMIPKIKKEVDDLALAQIFSEFADTECYVCIEDVHALFGSSAGSTFAFGDICGFMRGCLVCNKIRYQKIQPKRWQQLMFLGVPDIYKPMKPGQTRKVKDTKAMALVAVKRIFPGVDLTATAKSIKPHEGLVDALLIAEFCRRTIK